jgi:hypothetical protein
MVYWQRSYRLGSHTRQLQFDNPDGFFRGQPPREALIWARACNDHATVQSLYWIKHKEVS